MQFAAKTELHDIQHLRYAHVHDWNLLVIENDDKWNKKAEQNVLELNWLCSAPSIWLLAKLKQLFIPRVIELPVPLRLREVGREARELLM